MSTRWQYAKAVVNSTHVGAWVRLTRHAKNQGLQGRAKSDYGRVIRVEPPVGLVVKRDGLTTAESYFAGLWRVSGSETKWSVTGAEGRDDPSGAGGAGG